MAKDNDDEQSLFGSDTFTNNLIRSMQDGFSVVDANGSQLYVNPAFCRMTGYSLHELVATKAPFPYWPPEEYEHIKAAFQDTLAGNFKNFEMVFMRKNGERFPVIVSPSCVKDGQGRIINFTATVKDMTDMKRTQEALGASENRFRSLIENLSTGVVVHGAQTEILFANQAALQILGLTIDQILGKSAMDPQWKFVSEDEELLPLKDFPVNRIISTKAQVKNLVVGIFRPDLGENKWAICNGHPEFDKEGNLLQAVVNFTEITKQKKMEFNLKIERDRAEQYLDIVEVVLLALDKEAKVTLLNRKGYEVLGYEQGELEGKDWIKTCLPANEQQEVFSLYEKIISGDIEPIEYFENHVLNKSGEKRYIAWHNSRLKDNQGKIIGTLSSGEDITDRKRAEEALKENEEKLRSAYSLAHIGVWSWVLATNEVTWTEEYFKMLGLDPKGPVPSFAEIEKLHVGDSWERLQVAINQTLSSGDPYTLEITYKRADGSIGYAIVFGGPKYGQNGKILGLYGTVQDITERKSLEEKLFETNAFLHAAINQTHVGISIAIPSGSIKLLNQAGYSIMHIPTDIKPEKIDIVNAGFTRYTLEGTVLLAEEIPMWVALRQGKRSARELIFRWPDRQDKVVLVNATPIFGKDGSVIAAITVFLDITEKFNLERDLKEALEAAKNATIVKSRFLDIAAHELRTPVSAFSLLIQLAQKKIDQGIEVDPNTFVRLRKQVDRISQLVIDLLDVSRLERGAMKLKIERKDIGTLVTDCVEDIKLRSPDRQFKVFIPSEHPIECNIDVVRIYQVISNLLDNAIKYTPDNSPIEVSVQIQQEMVQVSVTDHGAGISKQQQDEMFQPFTRGSTELTDPAGGLGLGLFICKSIITLHGGTMEVRSSIGHGSTFTFNLPL
jgi:PAS domain S-box-containing protein